MEVWQIVLYGAAALLALRSLTSLMTAYRERLLGQLAARDEDDRRGQPAKADKSNGKKPGRPHAA